MGCKVVSKAQHWVPTPIPMGFGWVWVWTVAHGWAWLGGPALGGKKN